MILAKFTMDWADEFYIKGMALLTQEEMDFIIDNSNNVKEVTWYFGSNEGWENIPVCDFISNIEFSEISAVAEKELLSFWGSRSFGHFPEIEEMLGE